MSVRKPHTFRKLAETAQKISESRDSTAKITICSRYFSTLPTDADLQLAAQFLGEGAFAGLSKKRISVGSRTISTLAASFCEIDYEKVFKPCKKAAGSTTETIEKLFANIPEAREKWSAEGLSLRQIERMYERLSEVSSRKKKKKILQECWQRMTPLEVKYFIRIMGRGSLGIGLENKHIITALAKAFDHPLKKIRQVHMLTGSMGETAVLAKNNRLNEASFQLFHPVAFMLASPLNTQKIEHIDGYLAEEMFDGMRCQLHAKGNKVRIFSRDMNDVSSSFPEIIEEFSDKDLPETVLDGEICVLKDDTFQPFQLLQKRIDVKKPSSKLKEQYPATLIAFDMLFHDNSPLFERPLTKRRELLHTLSEAHQIPIAIQHKVSSERDLQDHFERALKHGSNGLILKHKDSGYEYGHRKVSWLKIKQRGGTLKSVMMYAHLNDGKKDNTYSGFTFGISVRDDDRYEEEFIPIGKISGKYRDEELARLNQKIKENTAERYGPTLGLIPGIIVELEFDHILVNKRTKANLKLHQPRLKTIHWDFSPEDVNSLKDVEQIYEYTLHRKKISQKQDRSFKIAGGE